MDYTVVHKVIVFILLVAVLNVMVNYHVLVVQLILAVMMQVLFIAMDKDHVLKQ